MKKPKYCTKCNNYYSCGHDPGYINCIKGHLYCPEADKCDQYEKKQSLKNKQKLHKKLDNLN